MTKYIIICATIIVGCNSSGDRATAVSIPIKLDSAIIKADSGYEKIMVLDSTVDIITEAFIEKVEHLKADQKLLEQQLEYETLSAPNELRRDESSNKDKTIRELNERINYYEKEISYLKKRIYYDSLYRNRTVISKKISEQKTIVNKPNDSSLVIEFDNKMKRGVIPIEGLDVYAIPFIKEQEVKKLMVYEIGCDLTKISRYNYKQAGYFDGKYFFNDLEPGKYLIKVCYYYGGYEVLTRKKGHQVLGMRISPPIQ